MEGNVKKKVVAGFIILIILLFAGYIYNQSKDFLHGPILSIEEPDKQTFTTTEERLSISGTAKNISSLTLNGATISINQHHSFNESLLLSPGFNIIELAATDRFGHVKTLTRTMVYKQENIEIDIATTTPSNNSTTTTP